MNSIELNRFNLPIVVQNDYEYVATLQTKYREYLEDIHFRQHISEEVYERTQANTEKILEAINQYLNANISAAKACIHEILNSYVADDFIVAELDNSTAFRALTRIGTPTPYTHPASEQPIRLFRARVGVGNFEKNDFLHIPFNKRGSVSTQRFSIAGVPSMYFGLTSYVCWLELGRPSTSEFNVSAYDVPGNIKILNLAITQMLLNGYSGEEHLIKPFLSLIQLFPLVIGTSFKVKETNRSFRSEYIVSQLITQCLADFGIDGVAYISKQVNNDSSNYPYCINLAVPMQNKTGKLFSDFAEKLPLTNPINVADYNHFVNPPAVGGRNLMSFASLFDHSPVSFMGKIVRYDSLFFCEIDDFIYNEEFEPIRVNPNFS